MRSVKDMRSALVDLHEPRPILGFPACSSHSSQSSPSSQCSQGPLEWLDSIEIPSFQGSQSFNRQLSMVTLQKHLLI